MSETDVNALHVQLARFEATITAKLDGIASDNTRGDEIHKDHEIRIRRLEANDSEGAGVWKVLTAGGAIGAALVGALALALRSLGV